MEKVNDFPGVTLRVNSRAEIQIQVGSASKPFLSLFLRGGGECGAQGSRRGFTGGGVDSSPGSLLICQIPCITLLLRNG